MSRTPPAWARRAAACCLLLLAALVGCGRAEGGTTLGDPSPQQATTSVITSGGVTVIFPRSLHDYHPDLARECLRRIDETPPEPDERIPPGARGVPAGMTVYVRQSGSFPVEGPAPGFALGSTDTGSRIWLALKRCSDPNHEQGDLLPALAHELRHVYTRDPNAGH